MVIETLPLTTIGIVIMFAIAVSIFFKKIGQNPVLGFIVSGFLLGPFVLNFLNPTNELVTAFAELGLFVLLFYLGLELSFRDFIKSGATSAGMALIDMTTIAGAGILICLALGFSLLFAVIVGLMLFSTSSAIVGKFLIDKGLTKEPAPQMALSILILQDFLGIMLLVFITSLSSSGSALDLAITALLFSVAAFFVVHKLSKVVEKWLQKNGFGNTEATFYALGIGLIAATLATVLGLSTAIGAYFAGFALSETKAGEKIKKDVSFLRDFFLLFFFVSFGSTLFFNPELNAVVLPSIDVLMFLIAFAVGMALLIIVQKMIVFSIFSPIFGLSRKDSNIAAVLLIPLGEFVVIIATAAITVLPATEATMISPIAFLLILVTLVLFQPLWNFRELYEKISAKIPTPFKVKDTKTQIQPHTPYTIKQIQNLGINLFILFGLAAITLLLYDALPDFGVGIAYSRQFSTAIIFLLFAIIPIIQIFKSLKNLFSFLQKEIRKSQKSLYRS
ncbi:MAG: cation:proton antiporter [archaeon]|nr:cation:proton antiporter [archaeon]